MKGHLKSIRYKLILILLLCSILPLSFSMCITYIYSRNNFSNEIISYNEQLMYQFSNNINTYLCDVSDGIYYPFSNAKMYSFLTKKDSSHYNDHNTIMTFMQSIQNLSNDIESILYSVSKKTKLTYFRIAICLQLPCLIPSYSLVIIQLIFFLLETLKTITQFLYILIFRVFQKTPQLEPLP